MEMNSQWNDKLIINLLINLKLLQIIVFMCKAVLRMYVWGHMTSLGDGHILYVWVAYESMK